MDKNFNKTVKSILNEAVDGGWEVPEYMVDEAYELAVQHLGKETIDEEIIRSMSQEEMAKCLAYIFRMYDFREWQDYIDRQNAGDDDEELYENRTIENSGNDFDYFMAFMDMLDECGWSMTDGYDKNGGVVYVIEPDGNDACSEEELKDKVNNTINVEGVKFGTRTSPQAPEMSKLIVFIPLQYQQDEMDEATSAANSGAFVTKLFGDIVRK